MAQPKFRTTVSVVFWTATPDESDAIVEAIKAQIPDADDRERTLQTVEYISAGKPVPPPLPDPPPAEEPAP